MLTLPLLERLVMPRNALARLPRGLSAHLPMLKELVRTAAGIAARTPASLYLCARCARGVQVLDNNCLAELPEDLGDLARLEMLSVRCAAPRCMRLCGVEVM